MHPRAIATTLLFPVLACGGGEFPSLPPAPTASAETTYAAPPPSIVPHAPKAPVALEEYFKILRVPPVSRSGLPLISVSSDESVVAYASDEGGRVDVWARPIASEGKPIQLTHVDGFVHSFAFSPREDKLVFEADVGGDELPRLYATDKKGSPPRELIPELPKGRRTQFVEFARSGATFLYLSNARDEKALDLLEYDLASKKSTVLWQASGNLAFAATSRDHSRFALVATLGGANTDVYVLDRGQKAPRLVTKHDGEVKFIPTAFSNDKSTLFVISDENGEFGRLTEIDLASQKRTARSSEPWDVDAAFFSSTGRFFVKEVNEKGTPRTTILDRGKPYALPAPPGQGSAWRVLGFSKSDRFAELTLQSDTAPPTSFIADLEKKTLVRVVDPMPPALRDRPMGAGEAVEIPSFDGKSVPAFLYTPKGAGPFPAVIDVHGGPTAQSKRTFSPFRQYLLSKGYAVLVPNVRGSTGYGKTWTKGDDLDLGGGPLKDIVACKRWLVEKAKVSPDKVVVFGGSYGGYMALVAEAFAADEFAANVDFFGVSDLKTLVESFPAYWASEASFIYQKFGDPKNPAHAAYQHDRSPIHFVSQMKRPLLVVQGDKDARVKKDQSDRIVDALKKQGTSVHYLVLENEGHGFSKTENNLRALSLTDRFLDRYIFGDTSVALPDP